MADENKVRAADITAPLDHIEMGGVEFPLAFDMNSMRVAEDVYEIQYRRNDNFSDILRHLAAGKLGAVMALLYGALLSGAAIHGKDPLTWDDFADQFRLTSIPAVRELLMKKLTESLPKAEESGENPPTEGET